MTGQRMLLLEVMALLLLYCKNGSYVPLCLLPILIPAVRFAGKREKYLSVGALAGIPLLAFAGKHMTTVSGIVTTTAATSVGNVIVNNCRRVIFRILTDDRVTYNRLSKISFHISLAHTLIDGIRKTSTFKVYLLTNFYEHDRHTSILTDWDHILSCNL